MSIRVILVPEIIKSVPVEYREVNQLQINGIIKKIIDTKEDYLDALKNADVDGDINIFTMIYTSTPNYIIKLYTMHPNGLITVGVDTNYRTELLDTDTLSHYLYIESISKTVDNMINTVDKDKLLDSIKQTREARSVQIRTELDALSRIFEEFELIKELIVKVDTNMDIKNIEHFFRILNSIILDGSENSLYELSYKDSKQLFYSLEFSNGYKIIRENGEINIETD